MDLDASKLVDENGVGMSGELEPSVLLAGISNHH